MTLVNGQPQCAANTPIVDSLNVIPQAFIDPIAAKLIKFQPEGAGYFVDNGVLRNAVLNRQVTQNETRYTLRLDHQLTKSDRVNFRYTKTPAIGVRNFGSDVNGSTGVFSDAKQILIGDDHTFSPTIVNSLKLNYTRGVFSEDFSPGVFDQWRSEPCYRVGNSKRHQRRDTAISDKPRWCFFVQRLC